MTALVLASGVVTAKVVNGQRPPSADASGAAVPVTATTSAPVAAGPPSTIVVTRYEDVIDRYVVANPVSALPGAAGGTESPTDPASGDGSVATSAPGGGSTSTTAPGTGPAPTTPSGSGSVPTAGTTAGPATTATTGTTTGPPASTTTTRPPTTTTTRPPGVPADWPADEPIPPIPPGCREPKLEDDGEWNCQH